MNIAHQKLKVALNIKREWNKFKSLRMKKPYFGLSSNGYITMLARESLIDDLLKIILD